MVAIAIRQVRLRALLLALAIVLPFVQPVYALDDLDEWDFSTDSNGTVVINEDGSVSGKPIIRKLVCDSMALSAIRF